MANPNNSAASAAASILCQGLFNPCFVLIQASVQENSSRDTHHASLKCCDWKAVVSKGDKER